MADLPFQSEIKIDMPNKDRSKATIALSPTGDIQLTTGREKLVTQMVRAIVNENVFSGNVLNSNIGSQRALQALVTNVFRNFRSRQITYVNANDPDLTGYSVWRKAAGSDEDYVRVSTRAVTWKYTDTDLENGTQYTYGLSRIYKDRFESQFVETFLATPTAFEKNQEWITGNYFSAIPGDANLTIYVDYNRQFKASEILNKLLDVMTIQDSVDPRKWIIHVQVEDYLGATVNVSSPKSIVISGV
jgi:hypothetical protein